MKKIVIRDVPSNVDLLHQHPLLHRIYAARGITHSSELDYDLKYLLPYDSLKGIRQAVMCLISAIQEQQPVLIIGDFDADGATSTALAISALKAFGLKNVAYLIPNRFEYGYGLTPEIVNVAAKQKPCLIVTVDNGIASFEGVDLANKLGIKVLITDHHLPRSVIPSASAIINPNQEGDEFSSKSIAGVGVVFYLMLALRANLRDIDWFTTQNIVEPNMAQFLDLVALGTIADSVNLDRNNRLLVTQGLNRIRSGKCCLGMKELFAVAKRSYEKASVYDLGFIIAPRINAAGRLDDMSLGVECLLAKDLLRARSIARELNVMNHERRVIEDDMCRQATRLVDNFQLEQNLPKGLCIFEESWHQGVLGILAGRLKDRLQRPVIAFTAISNDELKGSARSINNVHIHEVLSNIANKNPGLINKFGGHSMAAGLSLMRKNYEIFTKIFTEEVEKYITQEDLHGVINTDGELPIEYFNIDTALLLRNGGPWGAGFSEPMFFSEFMITNQYLVGKKHLKLTLQHLNTAQSVDAICFNVNPKVNSGYSKATVVYRLGINEYNNRRNLQLIISEIMSCK